MAAEGWRKLFGRKLFGRKKADRDAAGGGETERRAPEGAVTRESLGLDGTPSGPEAFRLRRAFTDRQLRVLRHGHRGNMDEKWSWYMEGDALFICRSWTGETVYCRMDLSPGDGNHRVAVFRPMRDGGEKEREYIGRLLDAWIGEAPDAAGKERDHDA